MSEWTRTLTPRQAMRLLQAQGAPAAAVQTNEDVYFDPHLRARGYVIPIRHADPQFRLMEHAGFPVRLSETPGAVRSGAPALGQHNELVLHDLLGLSKADVRELVEAGALA